ncbi:PEBP-like protein [Thozetella sp. PMI_491]|nr:PEBP-like protein [Thozetella sp. PMI_491]
MLSQSLAVLVAAATLALGKTPNGFAPQSTSDLVVVFSGISAGNGAVVAKGTTASQPQVGTTQKLTGTSYAVLMVDIDIPTNSAQTSTLLHWMQTGLTPATTAMNLNTTNGKQEVFLLQNTQNTAPAAEYFGPSPPARTPLSHRYTQVLIDTSNAGQPQMAALIQAAMNRQGFDTEKVLSSASLQDKVVAGNSFNVTNPGPAQDGAAGVAGAGVRAGANLVSASSGLVFGLVAAAGLFMTL